MYQQVATQGLKNKGSNLRYMILGKRVEHWRFNRNEEKPIIDQNRLHELSGESMAILGSDFDRNQAKSS
jgi:hypothetical protein